VPNAVCLPRRACLESWGQAGTSRSQVNKSSHPDQLARARDTLLLLTPSMPTRSICFCFPVTLATAGPAASVRQRSRLRLNTRGFWRPAQAHSWFVLYSPPRRWPLPILERLGHFPNALVHFAVKLAPPTASQNAECRLGLHRGHHWSVTWCRLCTRRREHTARPGTLQTVNRNHKFLFSIHTCDDADSPRKPAFARFRMALSRGTGIPLPSLLVLVHDRLGYARPLSPPRDDLILFEYYSC
jgi:hypothetical protein